MLAMSVPAGLKALQPYLKVAEEFAERDPLVAYWVLMYTVQRGIKMPGSKEREGKVFLNQKMGELEGLKSSVRDKEEVTEDTVGQAYVETVGLKLFSWADDQDRACNFGKAVIKAFYTASSLFESLRQFGELSLEVEEKMKYSKVKAVYLSTCLRTGEVPVPGNPSDDPEPLPVPPPNEITPAVAAPTQPIELVESQEEKVLSSSGAPIPPELLMRSEEHVKFAGSALQYQDVNTAVTFLQRALAILTTGQDLSD